jgi:hypothetical protein
MSIYVCACPCAESLLSESESAFLRIERFFDFLIRFVLPQGLHRPNGCGQPSNQGCLQKKTNDSGKRSTDGKKCQNAKMAKR